MSRDELNNIPSSTTAKHGVALTVVNFVDSSGEVINQWSGYDIPIPSDGEYVSFGTIDEESSKIPEDDSYQMDHPRLVTSVEYNYTTLNHDSEGGLNRFVSILVHISEE